MIPGRGALRRLTPLQAAGARARTSTSLAAALILLVALCLFFGSALRRDAILSPGGLLFDSPAFADAKRSPVASNPLLFDQVYQFIPWRRFTYDSLRAGTLPLWNPYSLSGTPFVATMQSAVFYPINLALTLVPFNQTFLISAILRLWIAGFATYLLARRYRLSLTSALVAAISFMLSGFLIVWLGHPHTNAAIWLPALILLAEQLVEPEPRCSRRPAIALLALIVGIQFTGGHIETSVDILFATGVYFLIRCWQVARQERPVALAHAGRAALSLALAVALGTALAAVQLLPFLEWLRLSAEYGNRAATGFRWLNSASWRNLETVPLLLFPNLYGNPSWDPHYVSGLSWTNYNEVAVYVGTLPLVLAALALATRWRANPFVRTWGLLGLLTLGMALSLPLFDWVNQLPGLALASPGRLRLVVGFSLSMLAGFGAEALFAEPCGVRQAIGRRWKIICAVIALCSLFAGVRRGVPPPVAIGDLQVDDVSLYAPLIAGACGLALLLLRHGSPARRRAARYLIILLTFGELFYYGQGYNPTLTTANFYPKPAAITAIQSDDPDGIDRITALRKTLVPDAQVMFHAYDIRGLDFPTKWYTTYLDALPDRLPWIPYGVIVASADSPLLRVLNLKYVISDNAADLAGKPYLDRVDHVGQVFVGEVGVVQPRSFMVYDIIPVPDDGAAQQLLRSRPDLVFDTALIPSAQHPRALAASSSAGTAPDDHVEPATYGPKRSTWRVATDRAGYLFMSDSYYPGWTAYIDGEPTTLYRTNIAFRSVYVPAGEHTIEFRYQPESVRLGGVLSLASLAIVLLLLLPSSVYRRLRVPVRGVRGPDQDAG